MRETARRVGMIAAAETSDMTTAIYSHPDCLRHEMGDWHPESPARLRAIDDQLISANVNDLFEDRAAPLVALADLERNHSKNAIAIVRDSLPCDGDDYYPIDGDTSLNCYSWLAAQRAAGSAVTATDAVIDGEIANAFCAIRPPGHHARPSEPMGFCLFNNVAIAAKHALDVRGLERVAIVDFDVHHGNGTAESVAHDPRILMVSFFQHPYYPYSDVESYTDTRVNVPVPARSKGDVVRQLVLDHWLPALHRHQPQMLFISAGFDAHREDDVGGMGMVEADYSWMTEQMMAVAKQYGNGRIVSCLEGGYNLSSLGRSVAAHVKALAE